MPCNGLCTKFKASTKGYGKLWRYADGNQRCSICDIWITKKGVKENNHCKCCNYMVRNSSRYGSTK